MPKNEYWVPIGPKTLVMHTPEHGYFTVTWCRGAPFPHPIRKNNDVWEHDTSSYLSVESAIMLANHQSGDFFFLKGDEFVPLTPFQKRVQTEGLPRVIK